MFQKHIVGSGEAITPRYRVSSEQSIERIPCETEVGRGTDDEDEVAARLRVAESELAAQGEFGHVVVNDRLEDAVAQLVSIVAAELQDSVKSA